VDAQLARSSPALDKPSPTQAPVLPKSIGAIPMPNATLRANARTLSKADRPRPTEKDFIDDLSYLPERYAMVCHGDCLEPEIASGSCLIFDKQESFKAGDLVILFRRRDLVPDGQFQGIVKRLVVSPPPWVKEFPYLEHPKSDVEALIVVEMLNPRRLIQLRCADLLGVHKCLGVVPPDMPRVKIKLPEGCRMEGQR
jgi:hypothetical protein